MDYYIKMKSILENTQSKFYSYTPNHLKNKLLVLKSIQGDFVEQDILDEINGLELQSLCINKISKIKLGRRIDAPSQFLVHLSADSIVSNLTKLNRLACQRIHWEPYRKNKVFQ